MAYSILINTCDKFEDCWNPFFLLFSKFWKDCKGKIFLNTEYKDFSYAELDITAVKGCERNVFPRNKCATWSQCLKWALETIDTDIVLYMQEDYFLKDIVKNDIIEEYVALMLKNPDIKCLHLTDQSVESTHPSEFPNLNEVRIKQKYRISCQAALWRKEELLSLVREQESAWEFEEFGSKRSTAMEKRYLAVSHDYVKLNESEIIPYIFTGIIQGRWYRPVIPLFEANGIEVDYSKRGFVDEAPRHKPFMKRVVYRLKKFPKILNCWIECRKLQNHSQK